MKIPKKILVTLMLAITFMLTGCSDDSGNADDPRENVDSATHEPTKPNGQGFRYDDEDEQDEEIKVGTTSGDGQPNIYSIYLLRESVDIKTRDPYRFTCKVRLVEGIDDTFRNPLNEPITLEGKKYSEYRFYPKDGEPHFKYKSAYFNPDGKESKAKPVRRDIVASKVYNYVTKNM